MSSLWHELRSVYPALSEKDGVACRLTYVDEDGEEVELETDSDLADAAAQANARSPRLLEVFLRPPTHVHSNMQRSALLDAEWESVQGDSNSPAVQSRSITAAAAPAPATVAVAAAPVEDQEKEEHKKAEPAVAAPEKPAPVAVEEAAVAAKSSPPAASAAPAVSAPAASTPASSPSGFVGSLFSIFGRSAAQTPSQAPESGAADVAPESSDSLSASSASLSSVCGSSSSVVESAQKPFATWSQEPIENENDAQSQSFIQAMDELAEEQRLRREQGSSDGRAQQAIAEVFAAMLNRAEESLGLSGVAVSPSASGAGGRREWTARPSVALLGALSGIEAAAFEPAIAQFVAVCTAHAAANERRRRDEEEEKLAAIVREMEREAEEKRLRDEAEAEAEDAQRRKIEAEAEAVQRARAEAEAEAEAKRAAVEEAERNAAAEEQAAEARLQREAQAEAARAQQAQAEEEEPQLPREPCLMFAGRVPVAAVDVNAEAVADPVAADPAVAPQSLAGSPVLVPAVPSVALPVASPLDASALSSAQRFNAALSELRDMGFGDDALNTLLLQRNNHDIGAVVDWLATNEACGGELKLALAAQLPQ